MSIRISNRVSEYSQDNLPHLISLPRPQLRTNYLPHLISLPRPQLRTNISPFSPPFYLTYILAHFSTLSYNNQTPYSLPNNISSSNLFAHRFPITVVVEFVEREDLSVPSKFDFFSTWNDQTIR
jgi:hypothetical protein